MVEVNNPKLIHSFYNFVPRAHNFSAFLAALNVIQEPMKYSPIFFYGKSGTGKTHLLKAVVDEFTRIHKKPALYATAEEFTEDAVFATINKEHDSFKEKYRNNNLLIIDDIQFLSGRKYAQEQLLIVMKKFQVEDRQIILSADCHPYFLPTFDDIFKDSCQGGLLIEVGDK